MTSGTRDLSRKGLPGLVVTLLLASSAFAQNPLGTAFTYQGQLQNNGVPQNGPCDLRFKLFDASSSGNQIGSTQTLSSVGITNGLFTVSLDFGASAFTGSARWLQSAVACPSGGSFTTLSPRQAMSPTPNAIFAENAAVATDGATLGGNGSSGSPLHVASPLTINGSGVPAITGSNSSLQPGVYGVSAGGAGVWGDSNGSDGVHGHTTYGAAAGVAGYNDSFGPAIFGLSATGDGVYGQGVYGVEGYSQSSQAVRGVSPQGDGVYGEGGNGVEGYSPGYTGVRGTSGGFPNGIGVWGSTTSGAAGVRGDASSNGAGVSGSNDSAGDGVIGYSAGNTNNNDGIGVLAIGTATCDFYWNCSPGSWAFRSTGYAQFSDNVYVAGSFSIGGYKNFVTPHPTDPSKQISYVSLEGPESGTYFRGTAHIVNGFAEVEVPESFRLVTAENGLTAVATPFGTLATIVCLQKSLEKIVFQGSADVEFDYIVNGVRAGFQDHHAIQDNRLFVPRRASDTSLAKLPAEAVRRLKANGILNDDGSVNEETARRMGWDQRPGWNEPERRPESR